jgi:hypothetical protein
VFAVLGSGFSDHGLTSREMLHAAYETDQEEKDMEGFENCCLPVYEPVFQSASLPTRLPPSLSWTISNDS